MTIAFYYLLLGHLDLIRYHPTTIQASPGLGDDEVGLRFAELEGKVRRKEMGGDENAGER